MSKLSHLLVCAEPGCNLTGPDLDPDPAFDGNLYCSDHFLDEVVVERAMTGRLVPLTAASRVEAVRRLARRGVPDPQIAALLYLAPRSVLRIRGKHDIPSRVEPSTGRRLVPSTAAERVEAVRELAARGVPDPQIAALLHITAWSVLRIRRKHEIPSRVPPFTGRLRTATGQFRTSSSSQEAKAS